MPGRLQIAQFPNPPAILSLTARAVARADDGDAARVALLVSDLALLVWAYQEVTDGDNWVRRMFGVVGGAYAIRSLTRR